MSYPPERRLFFLAIAFEQELLQFLHTGKNTVGASQHPSADLLDAGIRHQVHGNALTIGTRKFGGSSATRRRRAIPGQIANDVVSLVFDDVEVVVDNLAHDAAETLDIRLFPLTEMRCFFV